MRILIEDIKTKIVVGGSDILINPDLMGVFREYMSVNVPGAYFSQQYGKGKWDGKRYFLTPQGSMATGFLPTFLKYIEQEFPTLSVEIMDNRMYIPRFKPDFVRTIGDRTINEQYEHQERIIKAFNHYISFRGLPLYFPRGIVDAATNAGKTMIIAGIYLNMVAAERMLVIIHLKSVYRELLAYFKSIFGEVGEINDKHYTIKPVTLAMIQTLSKRAEDVNVKKDLGYFSILAVDECHRAGSSMYARTLVNCTAPVRVFLSGSAFDSKDVVSNMVIVGQSGPRLLKVAKKELMDKGISTPVKVKIHLCNTILRAPVVERVDCMDKLVYQSIERVSIMLNIIKSRIHEGPVLVAVERTKHGQFLLEALTNGAKGLFDRFNIDLTHSNDKGVVQKVEAFRDGELDVLISTGVIREGVNLPLIKTMIFAVGGESGTYIKQWMGRIERVHESKTEVEYHDFYDIGRYVQKNSLHRLNVYKAENLDITMNFAMKDTRSMTNVVIR